MMLLESSTMENVWQRLLHGTIQLSVFLFTVAIWIETFIGTSTKCNMSWFFCETTIQTCCFVINWHIHKSLIFLKSCVSRLIDGSGLATGINSPQTTNSKYIAWPPPLTSKTDPWLTNTTVFSGKLAFGKVKLLWDDH